MRIGVVIGIVVASCGSVVCADDKSLAETTAYCIGVHQHDTEGWKAGINKGTALEKAYLKDLELRKERRQALLEHAVKQKQINYVAAAKMTSAGYADAKLCAINTEQCMKDAVEPAAKKTDNEANSKMLGNCNKETEPICERAYKNCD